jgi:hypothetical protein
VNDIVSVLREMQDSPHEEYAVAFENAANEIDRLRAELADHERCGWSEKAWDGLAREADLHAEIDHLRAELATALDDHGHAVRSLAKREAAIARVRRRLDIWEYPDPTGMRYIPTREVRDALDGES